MHAQKAVDTTKRGFTNDQLVWARSPKFSETDFFLFPLRYSARLCVGLTNKIPLQYIKILVCNKTSAENVSEILILQGTKLEV